MIFIYFTGSLVLLRAAKVNFLLPVFQILIFAGILKFVTTNSHFLLLLLRLEILSLVAVFTLRFYSTGLGLSSILIFRFIVIMVGEACLGLGLLVFLGRLKSGELEVSKALI